MHANDPSAGSPTETLLRLLVPLSDKVHETSKCKDQDLNPAAVSKIKPCMSQYKLLYGETAKGSLKQLQSI